MFDRACPDFLVIRMHGGRSEIDGAILYSKFLHFLQQSTQLCVIFPV